LSVFWGISYPNSETVSRVLMWRTPLVFWRKRGNPVDTGSFLVGFTLGFSLAAFLGFTAQRILLARDQSKAYRRPQKTSADTEKTPLQVLRESIVAGCRYVLWLLILIVGLVIFAWLAFMAFQSV